MAAQEAELQRGYMVSAEGETLFHCATLDGDDDPAVPARQEVVTGIRDGEEGGLMLCSGRELTPAFPGITIQHLRPECAPGAVKRD